MKLRSLHDLAHVDVDGNAYPVQLMRGEDGWFYGDVPAAVAEKCVAVSSREYQILLDADEPEGELELEGETGGVTPEETSESSTPKWNKRSHRRS